MKWKNILENTTFIGGVLETIARNTKIPVIHRGRIQTMDLDSVGLKIELSPVVRQQPDGNWEKVDESVTVHLEHESLLPDGQRTFSENQNIKWTISDPGGGCVVVMSPVHPVADGLPPLREVCEFIIFYPPRPDSIFERETFENV